MCVCCYIISFLCTELKTAVRRFEAEYMAQHGGNKPSGADKDPIRPMMREYFTIKRQLQSSSKVLSKTAPAKLITKGEGVLHIIASLAACF